MNTEKPWYVVDATDKILGRLASTIANHIRGKDLATYTPSVDMGAFVIVVCGCTCTWCFIVTFILEKSIVAAITRTLIALLSTHLEFSCNLFSFSCLFTVTHELYLFSGCYIGKCRKSCGVWQKEDTKTIQEAFRATRWYDGRNFWPATAENSWKNYWACCSWHASEREGKWFLLLKCHIVLYACRLFCKLNICGW